jgi:hypothetical protein
MPRYYFHLRGRDDEGIELPDDRSARAQALDTFGAMIREDALEDDARMDVVDEAGRRVTTLHFSAGR